MNAYDVRVGPIINVICGDGVNSGPQSWGASSGLNKGKGKS